MSNGQYTYPNTGFGGYSVEKNSKEVNGTPDAVVTNLPPSDYFANNVNPSFGGNSPLAKLPWKKIVIGLVLLAGGYFILTKVFK